MTREEKLEHYKQVVEEHPDAKLKGAKSDYTSKNGHMFSFLSGEGIMALRFGKDEQKELMEEFGTDFVIQYNSVMHGYVDVPDDVVSDPKAFSSLFQRSYEYISSLEPKPTTKKKK